VIVVLSVNPALAVPAISNPGKGVGLVLDWRLHMHRCPITAAEVLRRIPYRLLDKRFMFADNITALTIRQTADIEVIGQDSPDTGIGLCRSLRFKKVPFR